MANNTLKIVVVSGKSLSSSTNEDNAASGDKKKKKSKLNAVLNFNDTIKSKVEDAVSPTTFFAVQSGVSLATQTARQFINYYVSDIGRASGDSNYQAIVNRRIEVATDALSVAGGALGGAAAGSMFGPVGAGIGAVVGAASAGVSLGFKYAERSRSYAHEMFEQETSQGYNLARANYSALTGRVR